LRRQDRVAELFSGHDYPEPLAEFLGISQLSSPKQFFTWDARTNFMPMATIGQKPIFLDDTAAVQAIASPNFKPREIVYLPPDDHQSVSASADPNARILNSQVTAEICQYETEAAHPTMLVMAQTWYHCWTAKIDGNAAPLLRANYGFQAVAIPAGQHQIRLIYNDTLFHIGVVVSLLSLGLGTLTAFLTRGASQI